MTKEIRYGAAVIYMKKGSQGATPCSNLAY